MIRDQANKTLNIYLDRVRKYGTTLPDSILPPPEVAASNVPRMSTPQGGNSWTGWAVSSFTNKLGTAIGEMQTANESKPSALERSASTPPTNGAPQQPLANPRPSPASAAPSAPAVPKAPSNLRSHTSAPADDDEEDFGDGWGDMNDDAADAWADAETQQPTPTETPRASTSTFDDQGEPDFEGWLTAQAQAKSKPSRPLPKGLAKKTVPVRPIVSARSSAPQVVPAVKKPSVIQPTKPVAKAAAPEDDEDWGDAWA